MELARKLSPKTLGFDKPQINALLRDVKDGQAVDLFVIAGRAKGSRTGESQYGSWTAFIGDFAAVMIAQGKIADYAPGVQVRSSRCHIPQPMEDAITSGLMESDGGVDFGIKVGVKMGRDGDGYEYVCTPTLKITESDDLLGIIEKSTAKLSLPAPAKESKK